MSAAVKDLMITADNAGVDDDTFFIFKKSNVTNAAFFKEIDVFPAVNLLRCVTGQVDVETAENKLD